MSKKNQPTALTATVGKVILYGRGLKKNPAREFDPEHAQRLLAMPNTQWSDKPFDVETKNDGGVANDSTDSNPI